MLVECVLDIFYQFKHNPTAHKYTYFAIISQCLLSPMNHIRGGDSTYERGGDARPKLWTKPLKETDLVVDQAFFDP